jgi:phosphoglycerol transferase MdoB-like AlkP superfamily enzyme
MDAKTTKFIQFLMYGLLGVSVIMIIAFYFGGTDSITFASGKEYAYPSFTDNMIYWTYALFGVALIASLVFPIITMAGNPKSAKNTLIGIVALVAVVGVAYVLASGAIPTFHNVEKFNITESISKNVGTMLYTTYLLGGLAILGILLSAVSKSIK